MKEKKIVWRKSDVRLNDKMLMTKAEGLSEAEVECPEGTCSHPEMQGLEGATPAVVLAVAREKSLLFGFGGLWGWRSLGLARFGAGYDSGALASHGIEIRRPSYSVLASQAALEWSILREMVDKSTCSTIGRS
jgi:hypothetical protein